MYDKNILELLHDHYEESIFITDGEGVILFANRVAAERIGLDYKDIEGKRVDELVGSDSYQYSTTMQAIKSKEVAFAEISAINGDQTFSKSIPVLKNGKVKYVVTSNMSLQRNLEWGRNIEKEREEAARLRRELDYFRLQDQTTLVSNSPLMKNIINIIDIVAPTESNIVILGDSGTGKDVVARFIHEKSNRHEHSFISINCAAMPENLLESELFGYEGGSFTGALAKGKIGLFEATSYGTLFLDEIGEMSLPLQSKLLRVLENREIRRVGGVKNIPINCRIICATNEDLQDMVNKKKFREDLYYRLNVFKLELPPLKERKEDIIPIAQMFLSQLNNKYGKNKELSDITVETMLSYDWPGNIRELRNVIERLFVISKNNELIFTPIPTAKYGNKLDYVDSVKTMNFKSLKDYTAFMEKKYIQQVLNECNGSVKKAAEIMGIHRSALYRKINK